MNIIIAAMLAQSLWGDLGQEPAPVEAPAAPYAAQNVEANKEVLAYTSSASAPAEEAKSEQPAPDEAKVEEPKVEEQKSEEAPAAKEQKSEEPSAIPALSSFGAKIGEGARSVKITSERTDYDRREGVIMFDKNVFVDDAEYKMHSDQLYVFLDGTNELKRIVAIGNVAITNETRYGYCAKAAYTKNIGKVVMYGDGLTKARLADDGKHKSEVEGKKITFWIDSEQVEVEGSTVTLDASGIGGKEGAKKLLGK